MRAGIRSTTIAAILALGIIPLPAAARVNETIVYDMPASAVSVSQANWSLYYELTQRDGIAITYADYKGDRVFFKATLPYIRVTYTYPDCPSFDNCVVVDRLGPDTIEGSVSKSNITNGFKISATFIFGDYPVDGTYKYVQSYSFWKDGRFQVLLKVYGPGYGPSGHYDTMWRIDFDVLGSQSDTLEQWTSTWTLRTTENRFVDGGAHGPWDSEWANNEVISGQDVASYYTVPYAPDTMYLYGIRYHAGEEGTGDYANAVWPTAYDNDESINLADIVNWYEAHSYPCSPSNVCYPGPYPFIIHTGS